MSDDKELSTLSTARKMKRKIQSFSKDLETYNF